LNVAILPSDTNRTGDLAHRAAVAADVWDALRLRRMIGGEPARLGAIVENIIAAIQAKVEPSRWAEAGASTGEAIASRCSEPSAVASVLIRLRPAIADIGRGFQPSHMGTDAVGRGAGWQKTANTVEIAKACNDVMVDEDLPSGELFRALKDIVVTALHALGVKECAEAGIAVARLIERRMVAS
jgi:hypothetical protein